MLLAGNRSDRTCLGFHYTAFGKYFNWLEENGFASDANRTLNFSGSDTLTCRFPFGFGRGAVDQGRSNIGAASGPPNSPGRLANGRSLRLHTTGFVWRAWVLLISETIEWQGNTRNREIGRPKSDWE